MLFARRRLWWFATTLGLALSCNEGETTTEVTETPTSILIVPEAFLGPVACGSEPGGLLVYQATLIDVTEGLADAPTLPSSPVVDCTSTVAFETATIGHRYGARIAAFAAPGLEAESEGSPTVVDAEGNEVLPTWTTTCTGHDGELEQALGGADGDGEGGTSGNLSLGVLAVENSAVPVRGCAPLSGDFPPELTGVRLDLTRSLGTLSCGSSAGEVFDFAATLVGDAAAGGAGGLGGSSGALAERTACATPLEVRNLEPGTWVTIDVLAFEAEATAASWSTTCEGRTELGTLTDVSCDRLRPL